MAKRFFEGIQHSVNYSLYRPTPPQSLVQEVASKVKSKALAVDIGCGGGQSTRILAPYFNRVVGVDVSEAQLEAARKANVSPNVEFRLGPGETLPFDDNSVDLLTCCQAIHWFNFEAFYKETDRVLKPHEGCVAIYGYHLTGPSPLALSQQRCRQIESLRDRIFNDITGKYWPRERKLVDEAYTTIPPIPYPRLERSDHHFTEAPEASLQDFGGYIQTWSGFDKFKTAEGDEAADAVIQEFFNE